MPSILGIPWYIFGIAGALFGLFIGLVFKGLNFEVYFFKFSYLSGGLILVGAIAIFASMILYPNIPGYSEVGDTFFVLLEDLGAFYAANLVAVWLFKN